jgi:uncharacterized membrane protein
MTHTIEEHIDVEVPIGPVYNQWTQFETFPEFMDGVDEITQTDDKRLHWTISIGGVKREFDAEITEQEPDQRIAWRAISGTGHAGVVTFHKIEDSTTRVTLQIDTEPEGLVERVGDALRITDLNARGDLKRFKEFIESREGRETGAYREEIPR